MSKDFMRKLKAMFREAVKMGLLPNVDFNEDAIGFNPKDETIFVAKNYTSWLFGKIDELEIIEIDLEKGSVKRFEKQ